MAVAEGTDYPAITRKAINAVGGMKRYVKAGDLVVVKPNMGWDRSPEFAANSHPLVVRAVVEECLAAGARKVKVFDHTCNDPRRCYVNSGIEKALKGLKGVECKQIEPERFRMTALKGQFLKEWELYDEALAANVFINLPVAKHHGLSRLTLGLKNIMGVMGGNRGLPSAPCGGPGRCEQVTWQSPAPHDAPNPDGPGPRGETFLLSGAEQVDRLSRYRGRRWPMPTTLFGLNRLNCGDGCGP